MAMNDRLLELTIIEQGSQGTPETGLLELTITKEGSQGISDWAPVYAASLDDNAWASLIQQCITQEPPSITFFISRDILQQKSSFFRSLLGGEFRESSETHVNVTWDPVIFCSLLHCICLGKLHLPCHMESFFEGLLFFGVEAALLALAERISSGSLLKWAPKLWSLAKGMGEVSVAEACVESFAINFEEGIIQSNLQYLSSGFLAACIDHMELTVTSEKFLCEAVLNWFSCKKKFHGDDPGGLPTTYVHPLESNHIEHNYDHEGHFFHADISFYGIIQKVKVLLLPMDFVLGSVSQSCPASMFCVKAAALKSYDDLFPLLEEAAGKTIQQLQAAETDDLPLRITKHSTKVDLAGCHQITAAILFQALLQCLKHNSINSLESCLEVEAELQKVLCNKTSSLMSFEQAWCRKLSLQFLVHVNLERCWRIDQDSLVTWLCVACPNLKFLNVSHCPQLNANILPQISLSCKNLENICLALYFKRPPIKPLNAADVVSTSSLRHPESNSRWGILTCLASLSLEGRSGLMDHHLTIITRCCSNLSTVNLGGCSQLTDRGLAHFLGTLKSLTVLEAAYTAFGALSVDALLCQSAATPSPPFNISDSFQSLGILHSASIALTTLDLEGCSGVDNVAMAKLLNKTLFLRTLNLGYTGLDDSTLSSFRGTSLLKLNLRETQVSECGIAHILKWNQYLKVLNMRGCRRVTGPLFFKCAKALQDEHTVKEEISEGLALEYLAVGWGFSDYMLRDGKSIIYSLQSLSIGLGGKISEGALAELYKACPQLKHLSLSLQVISDTGLISLLKNLPTLERLELHQCLGEISSKCIAVVPTNLASLTLERGVAWMTDADVEILGATCKCLTSISFVGCRLLTPKSLHTIASTWRGMKNLGLQECGTMTCNGGFCLLACKGLQQLTLRHNGPGLPKSFVECACIELPLLQDLCLDICDSVDKGYNSIDKHKLRSLRMLRFTRCKSSRNCINDSAQRHYKDTVLIEWINTQEITSLLHEGL